MMLIERKILISLQINNLDITKSDNIHFNFFDVRDKSIEQKEESVIWVHR